MCNPMKAKLVEDFYLILRMNNEQELEGDYIQLRGKWFRAKNDTNEFEDQEQIRS